MNINVLQKDWLKLDGDTKRMLRERFAIPKTGPSETNNGVQTSDGVTNEDLRALSIGKMIAYLREDCAFYTEELCETLLELTINKLYGREPKRSDSELINGADDDRTFESGEPIGGSEETKSRGRGRPRKEAISL